MAKYMFLGSYTAEGAKGLLRDGGTKRRQVLDEIFKSLGGRIEAFYYAFGDHDVVVIGEVPDNVSVAAVSLAVNASGGASAKTTVLLTPEEIDQATRKAVKYRAPGQ